MFLLSKDDLGSAGNWLVYLRMVAPKRKLT